jgi:hypothetical protein
MTRHESSRRMIAAAAVLAILILPGCFSMQHTVGAGPPPGNIPQVAKQWYALYGLVPLGHVDGGQMAGGARDFRITTEFTFTDVLLSSITSFFTFYRQSVIVES